jgi:hypothetical protein
MVRHHRFDTVPSSQRRIEQADVSMAAHPEQVRDLLAHQILDDQVSTP